MKPLIKPVTAEFTTFLVTLSGIPAKEVDQLIRTLFTPPFSPPTTTASTADDGFVRSTAKRDLAVFGGRCVRGGC